MEQLGMQPERQMLVEEQGEGPEQPDSKFLFRLRSLLPREEEDEPEEGFLLLQILEVSFRLNTCLSTRTALQRCLSFTDPLSVKP